MHMKWEIVEKLCIHRQKIISMFHPESKIMPASFYHGKIIGGWNRFTGYGQVGCDNI